jgi:DNA-binding NarL/FixJ family response regulator
MKTTLKDQLSKALTGDKCSRVSKRTLEIAEAIRSGLTQTEVATKFGISRQRVWQIKEKHS